MLNDSEPSPDIWASVQAIAIQVLQAIDIRLALLIGLAVFTLAVGFDSAGNQAKAADLSMRSVPVRVLSPATFPDSGVLQSSAAIDDAQQETSRRLHHGTLTSAILTNNRLTDAHLFTDLPDGSQR